MKTITTICIIVTLLTLLPHILSADTLPLLRPQAGYGLLQANGCTGIGHSGIRMLLPAGSTQRYGIEINRFVSNNMSTFTSIGIVLEQRLHGWCKTLWPCMGCRDHDPDTTTGNRPQVL